MNLVFNVGEQLAELCQLSKETPLPGLNDLLGEEFWKMFIEEDAKVLLRHYLGKRRGRVSCVQLNAVFTESIVRLLMEVGYSADDVGNKSLIRIYRDPTNFYLQDDGKGGLVVVCKKDLPVDHNGEVLDPPPHLKCKSLEHYIDDFLDEVYFEVHLELDEFIHGFMRRGDIWTCTTEGRYLIFDYCCNTASVEAAVRASGGNFADFIAHMTS